MDAFLQPKLPILNNEFSAISDAGAVCSHSCASTHLLSKRGLCGNAAAE